MDNTISKGIEIIEGLRGHTSGYAIPQYVVDGPGGGGKIPLNPQYIMECNEERTVLRNYEGKEFVYPEAQLALGQAYLGMTQQLEGMEAGKYATLADKALDQALELEPEHWEARFTKAVALSFWPPILGKQPLAIRQFETLMEQQASIIANETGKQTGLRSP